jgi:CMP-N-acetylneuraminic acid synthetase
MDRLVAVIPAKAKSERLPGKNERLFAGKPLIQHTIEQALKSKEVDKVYVSTDSEEIADISRNLGAEVPFMRPPELSNSDVHSVVPVLHLLEKINAVKNFDYVMALLPTCPLRKVHQINEIAKLAKMSACNVLSVVDTGKTKYHLKMIDKLGHLTSLVGEPPINFQHGGDSRRVFSLNGSCYCGPLINIFRNKSFHCEKSKGYIMDEITGMDIDTLEQFEIAEALFKMRNQNK